jgi:dienelactone hydrolase
MIGQPRLHCRGDAKRLVNPAVVVVHEVQGNREHMD